MTPEIKAAPKRIQRKRTKGWRMPPNTICVTRPGKWGNPFSSRYRVEAMGESIEVARKNVLDNFRRCIVGDDSPLNPDYASAIETMLRDIEELRGKNLACWCPLDRPCHADVLLEIANR